MGLLTSLLLTSILTTLSLPSPSLSQSTQAYPFCYNDTFTANSTYQSNLRHLLGSLASSSVPSGFNTSTTGSVPDRVQGLALCRGDVSSSSCRDCLDIATSDAEQNCPYAKSATIYYDYCQLRYSNLRLLSVVDSDPIRCVWNNNNVRSSESARFNASVRAMLGELRGYAVHNATSPPLFAAGEVEFGGEYGKINGMVQCTRDISADECDHCLHAITQDPWRCFEGIRVGARVLAGSCSWRYETYEFFNWTQSLEIPALTAEAPGIFESLPPPPSPPVRSPAETNGTTRNDGDRETSGSNSNNTTATVLGLVIVVAVAALLLH